MSEIQWEDPPKGWGKGRLPGKHAAFAAALRDRPGLWAVLDVFKTPASASAMARHIKKATLQAYAPTGTYEAVSRTVEGECRVYARYVGEA